MPHGRLGLELGATMPSGIARQRYDDAPSLDLVPVAQAAVVVRCALVGATYGYDDASFLGVTLGLRTDWRAVRR